METGYVIWVIIIYCANKFSKGWYERRLDKIADFYDSVQQLCESYDQQHEGEIIGGIKQSACEWVFEILPDTNHLLFTFRKLRLESWLNTEQYDELMKQ